MPQKILGFRATNRTSQPFEIKAKSATKAEIILYASIGDSWFGDSITAKKFSDELKALESTVNEITVRINSPGGDVFDGITIYNRLKQHKAKIIVRIDGLAASIASIIALAGDEVIIGEGALFMIHKPWTFAMGNSDDLDATSSRLIDVEEQLVSIYNKRTGLDRSEIKAMLKAETWMDADQAIEKGFVDRKEDESIPLAASIFENSKWITKAPKTFKSETAVIHAAKDDLKNKIEKILARK
jgi:ATP-dependent Clp endopeptidase proteolytic subunit ClpP